MQDGQTSTETSSGTTKARSGFRTRHLTMMGLGSAIGAGLFLGSGAGIAMAGPAIIVSYAVAGALVLIVMRAVAEMVSAHPSTGSFATYASQAFNKKAGFTLGWLYWFLLIMVLIAEISGAAGILHSLVPTVPQWGWALIFVVSFAAVNLWGVRNFGEFEFWLSGVKVVTVVVFLIIGVALIVGIVGDGPVGFSNLVEHGGFAPQGFSGVAAGLLAVMFSFGGIEIITIAAAEADRPREAIRAATKSIFWRILIFYIGSMLVIATLLPWNDPAVSGPNGPFVAVLQLAHIPAIATVMQIIAALALLSAFNANIYATSRMAYSLTAQGEGFAPLLHLSKRKVPTNAVLASIVLSLVGVFLNWWIPGQVFTVLLDLVGAALLVVWAGMLASQLRLHRELEREGSISLRMWWHPWLSWIGLVGLAAFAGLMLWNEQTRWQLLGTIAITLVIWLIGLVRGVDRHRLTMPGDLSPEAGQGSGPVVTGRPGVDDH
ncbi:amino acid permease [Pseudoclavibacter sp. CFCC 13796]|uniref:amino acid permease n=1 Tax=Pseudoclavibacter sp. CFCC 13796 TaxID=2615179 RepID=UPI001300DC1E|nr:amino acid permease [Pseudoclavibacter sp. CFCC 13796]KAB1661226.1 amino acid permease [Pseudoclavibacter sp. CFCC 13796]